MSWNLNRYQEEAVSHLNGPCLVTSCPGSGKTFTIVERTVRLIEQGVKPKNILCLTFTNKAANEMKNRICKRLKDEEPGFFIGTFHSLCARLIRKLGPKLGYSARFNILDERDQGDLVMQIARKMGYDIKYGDARRIANKLNFYRDQMEEFEWVEEELKLEPYIKIAREYVDRCRKDNLIDFSGLIYEAINILEGDDKTRAKVQKAFRYIMVDETQDTNKAQFHLVNLLGAKWRNIMLIGDIDQCIVEGEKVLTTEGYKNIENIRRGSYVLSASGGGKISPARIFDKYKKWVVTKPIVKITTVSGRKITTTKEHMFFADYIKFSPKKIVVYLMYDREFGYRIGVTNTKRKHGLNGCGVGARLQQERAEYLWILKSVDTIDEAKYWEQYYSVKYGIPTWCFYSHKKKRNLDYSDGSIKKLFASINTRENAQKMMSYLWLSESMPHYIPRCMSKNQRRNFTINMCADARSGTVHRYMISGSDNEDGKRLKKAGLNVRKAGRGRRGWRVESAWKSIGKIYEILKVVRETIGEVNLIEKARFCEETLSLMPASHLREGMAIYVSEDQERVTLDYIRSIEFDFYTGNVYDINVDNYHNFVTNGIVSHNSIYGWRGARYQNIQAFIDNYDDCKVVSLSKNYRSTPQIIKKASNLIRHNSSHLGTRFETDNNDGEPVRCYSFSDQVVEADRVGEMAKRLINEGGWEPSDIAVLYRVNKMSEPIEQAMVNHGIPYEVIGSRNFYDRLEIRDCMAMLKFLSNQRNGIAFNRVCSFVKGMGAVTIGKIENLSQEENISIPAACKKVASQVKSVNIIRACEKIHAVFNYKWDVTNPAACLKRLINRFGYRKHLLDKFEGSATEREDNIEQLIDSAGEFNGQEDGVSKYLQRVSLVTNSDKEVEGNKIALMSLHAAKGLEFPIVFMIGVEHNILPHGKALADDPYSGLEEERRLCYVGMTRAKKVLFVTWCRNRRRFGKHGNMTRNKCQPSQFLAEAGLLGG